jgi:hypothetical protein
MTILDGVGVFGVLLILIAYAGATTGRLDPKYPPALLLNLVGAALILLSMTEAFNLAAFLMEASWALVALHGLLRPLFARKR